MKPNHRGCVGFYPVDDKDSTCTTCDHSGDNGQCAFFTNHECTEGQEATEDESNLPEGNK